MNRLQLATLLSWAGNAGVQGRKRLQKVVFFLQQAGCPLNCQYTLHHFGPYSRDVAETCDEMVAAGLINEIGGPQSGVMQYAYTLTPSTANLLAQAGDGGMQRFQGLGAELIGANLWHLELGSTIVLFYRQTGDWEHALGRACEFKKVPANAQASLDALAFARRIVDRAVQ